MQKRPAHPVTAVAATAVFLVVAGLAFDLDRLGTVTGFAVAWLLVAAAMLATGPLITAVASGRVQATAAGTVLYLPLLFLAGLWLPVAHLPPLLRDIGYATPFGAGMQVFQQACAGDLPSSRPLLVLAASTVVCAMAAAHWFRRP